MTILRIYLRNLILAGAITTATAGHCASPVISDMASAREYCDGKPLRPVEGIWSFPQDHISVLIASDDNHRSTAADSYTLYVVESEDCRLRPGDVAGKMEATPDPQKFKLSLYTRRTGKILGMPIDCVATMREEGESLIVKAPDIKIKINPMVLFSKFWRLVRIRIDNPVESLPAGMLRIYPGYDGNGSLRRIPRYL